MNWREQQAAILAAFAKSFTPKDEGPSRHSLEVVDFVRFPDGMKDGTRCSNCQYEDGGTCHFHGDINGNAVDLRGLQVFHDTCCAAWDRDGVTRPWEKGEGEKAWEGVLDLDAAPRLLRDAPDVRQPNRYFCGAAATKCVLGYYGVGPDSLEEVAEALGTTVERSTHPYAIRDYLESLGLQVEALDGMSILDLDSYTKRGYPVIVCVQDYMGRRDPKAEFDYGHYLTVLRVVGQDEAVICQDSSIQNLQRQPGGDVPKSEAEKSGNIAMPGRIIVNADTWNEAWHDRDVDGNKFIHFGIAVGPPVQGTPDTAGAV